MHQRRYTNVIGDVAWEILTEGLELGHSGKIFCISAHVLYPFAL